jgi:hypothetical protein
MIAWFPGVKVIRLIGPDCFATLNLEAHEKAKSDFEIEQEKAEHGFFALEPSSFGGRSSRN